MLTSPGPDARARLDDARLVALALLGQAALKAEADGHKGEAIQMRGWQCLVAPDDEAAAACLAALRRQREQELARAREIIPQSLKKALDRFDEFLGQYPGDEEGQRLRGDCEGRLTTARHIIEHELSPAREKNQCCLVLSLFEQLEATGARLPWVTVLRDKCLLQVGQAREQAAAAEAALDRGDLEAARVAADRAVQEASDLPEALSALMRVRQQEATFGKSLGGINKELSQGRWLRALDLLANLEGRGSTIPQAATAKEQAEAGMIRSNDFARLACLALVAGSLAAVVGLSSPMLVGPPTLWTSLGAAAVVWLLGAVLAMLMGRLTVAGFVEWLFLLGAGLAVGHSLYRVADFFPHEVTPAPAAWWWLTSAGQALGVAVALVSMAAAMHHLLTRTLSGTGRSLPAPGGTVSCAVVIAGLALLPLWPTAPPSLNAADPAVLHDSLCSLTYLVVFFGAAAAIGLVALSCLPALVIALWLAVTFVQLVGRSQAPVGGDPSFLVTLACYALVWLLAFAMTRHRFVDLGMCVCLGLVLLPVQVLPESARLPVVLWAAVVGSTAALAAPLLDRRWQFADRWEYRGVFEGVSPLPGRSPRELTWYLFALAVTPLGIFGFAAGAAAGGLMPYHMALGIAAAISLPMAWIGAMLMLGGWLPVRWRMALVGSLGMSSYLGMFVLARIFWAGSLPSAGLPAPLAAPASPPPGWVRHDPTERRFRLLWPSKPGPAEPEEVKDLPEAEQGYSSTKGPVRFGLWIGPRGKVDAARPLRLPEDLYWPPASDTAVRRPVIRPGFYGIDLRREKRRDLIGASRTRFYILWVESADPADLTSIDADSFLKSFAVTEP